MTCPAEYAHDLVGCRDYLAQQDAFFTDWSMAQVIGYVVLMGLILLSAMAWVLLQPWLDHWWQQRRGR